MLAENNGLEGVTEGDANHEVTVTSQENTTQQQNHLPLPSCFRAPSIATLTSSAIGATLVSPVACNPRQ